MPTVAIAHLLPPPPAADPTPSQQPCAWGLLPCLLSPPPSSTGPPVQAVTSALGLAHSPIHSFWSPLTSLVPPQPQRPKGTVSCPLPGLPPPLRLPHIIATTQLGESLAVQGRQRHLPSVASGPLLPLSALSALDRVLFHLDTGTHATPLPVLTLGMRVPSLQSFSHCYQCSV